MSHIALCEDDPILRDLETEVLQAVAGHRVFAFSTAEALVAALPSLQPSLIIMDVGLPRMNGILAYQHIRRLDACRNVPVLFFTSNPEHVHAAALTGNYAVAAKPMDIDSLLMVVSYLLRRDLAHQH